MDMENQRENNTIKRQSTARIGSTMPKESYNNNSLETLKEVLYSTEKGKE